VYVPVASVIWLQATRKHTHRFLAIHTPPPPSFPRLLFPRADVYCANQYNLSYDRTLFGESMRWS
jgi:hypothetical protein